MSVIIVWFGHIQNSLNDEITDGVIYLHSLLHTKLLKTVSSNSTFHKHGIFSFNKLSLITQLPFPGKVRILSKRGGALTKLCGMGHIWAIYGYCSGVTLCVTLCVTCYVNNMHARCPYKTHLRFIQAECEVSNG